MRRLLALVLLLLGLPALADGPVEVVTRTSLREAYQGRCRVSSTYPEVVGRPELNRAIRALLPQPVPRDQLFEDWDVIIEQDFCVTYNAHGLLSVFGSGLRSDAKDGKMIGAHPTKLFDSLVLDVESGQSHSLRDLFGQDVYVKLDDLLAQRVAQLLESDEVRPLEGHTYRCYLSPEGVTFYRLFDMFALAGLEVTIPYHEVVTLAPPGSPLQRFVK